jgi:hypothetical protein
MDMAASRLTWPRPNFADAIANFHMTADLKVARDMPKNVLRAAGGTDDQIRFLYVRDGRVIHDHIPFHW